MQILSLLSDILLIAATVGLAVWCRLLSNRLRAFNAADAGTEETIAALARRVDDLRTSIAAARIDTTGRDARIAELNAGADDRIGRMEMLLASLEDLEEESADRLLQAATPGEPTDDVPSFRASRSPAAGGHA